VNTTDWELQSCPGRSGLGLAFDFSAFATSGHFELSIGNVVGGPNNFYKKIYKLLE
jgi:hypothetical protein